METKPKTSKKRYTSKEDIISQIDKFTAKRDKYHQQAAQLLHDSKELFRMAALPDCTKTVTFTSEARSKQDKAQKIGKQVKRLEEKVLPVWKRKLAEFQTTPIPGFLPDGSVEEPSL